MQVAPDGGSFAIGSCDNKIYVYDVRKEFALRAKCEKHHSYIKHIDFSADSAYIQSNCGGYELQFFSAIDGEHVHTPSITKDVEWNRYTCTMGWYVQGIHPEYVDGVELSSCDKSHNGRYVATTDEAGRIKVFRYPCLTKGADFVSGYGHTTKASKVRFSADDSRMITIGQLDRTILQWKVIPTKPLESGSLPGESGAGTDGSKKKKKKKGSKNK